MCSCALCAFPNTHFITNQLYSCYCWLFNYFQTSVFFSSSFFFHSLFAHVSVTSSERFVTSVTWRYSFSRRCWRYIRQMWRKNLKKVVFRYERIVLTKSYLAYLLVIVNRLHWKKKLCCKLDALYINSWVQHRKNSQNSWKCLTPGHFVSILRTW